MTIECNGNGRSYNLLQAGKYEFHIVKTDWENKESVHLTVETGAGVKVDEKYWKSGANPSPFKLTAQTGCQLRCWVVDSGSASAGECDNVGCKGAVADGQEFKFHSRGFHLVLKVSGH